MFGIRLLKSQCTHYQEQVSAIIDLQVHYKTLRYLVLYQAGYMLKL